VPLARETNDLLAEAGARHPGRLAGFAALPTADPEASATELERCVGELGLKGAMVNGMPMHRFLDEEFFWPVLERAEALDVPLYLHPAQPPPAIMDCYYAGLKPAVGAALATSAWGWHIETGLHALRLMVSGVFDRFPRLQVVIGHMGEAIPFMLARAEEQLSPDVTGLQRPLADYVRDNLWVTTSGFFTFAPLLNALLVLGVDRVIFSVDYPFASNGAGRSFLDSMELSQADREKIAHGNVERRADRGVGAHEGRGTASLLPGTQACHPRQRPVDPAVGRVQHVHVAGGVIPGRPALAARGKPEVLQGRHAGGQRGRDIVPRPTGVRRHVQPRSARDHPVIVVDERRAVLARPGRRGGERDRSALLPGAAAVAAGEPQPAGA
jgi:predicted TIM-barrel fold metal-dependent hydrolase